MKTPPNSPDFITGVNRTYAPSLKKALATAAATESQYRLGDIPDYTLDGEARPMHEGAQNHSLSFDTYKLK